MAGQRGPKLDKDAEAALEDSAARIAQIIAAAAYEVSLEVAQWPQELREKAAAGFKTGQRTQ